MQGFDFAFIRRSRLYDQCSKQTNYEWDSQYIGGTTLAVCNGKVFPCCPHALTLSRNHTDAGFYEFLFPEEPLQISGAKTAYFPKNQNCLATKSSSQQQSGILNTFIKELRELGVDAERQHACLVCGEQKGV